MDHSQVVKRVKSRHQEINYFKNISEGEALFWTFVVLASQPCNVIVEIINIKYGLLSAHFFQGMQQHGGCTKPLVNDKFV